LPPGTHRFRVAAALDGGPWAANEAILALRIAPRFYQTWWFFAACTGGGVALLWSAHRYRVRQLVAVERVRTRIASDLHDDIGSSLSQIAILSEVVRARVAPAPAEITDPIERIGSLSRESVDAMGDIVWAIDPQQGTPTQLSQRMRRLASDLLPPRGMQLQFTSTDEAHARLGMETRREVFLIFKEALHNILRHSAAGEVTIALTIDRRALRLSIADDGAGFDVAAYASAPEEGQRQGQGLRSIRRRAEAIGGRVDVSSAPGRGTSIVVEVPIR
jgi:signal transduction histidine kinase